MFIFKRYFLTLGIVVGLETAIFCSNLEAQNYTQTTRTAGYRDVYINTGPQNPLLNNLQAGWETERIQANAELARAQATQVNIQNQIMIEQAVKQEQQEQMIRRQQQEIDQLRRQRQ